MKKIYQTIKQTAKKYALPAIMAGSMALGSCSNNEDYLPVSKEISDKLKTEQTKLKTEQSAYLDFLSVEAEKTLELAAESFNKGIEDKVYTIKEMKETLAHYNKADSLYGVEKDFAKNIDGECISMPKGARKIEKSLAMTLNTIDFGKANLEKRLDNAGYKVKVENPITNMELGLILFGVIFGIVTGGIGYSKSGLKKYFAKEII